MNERLKNLGFSESYFKEAALYPEFVLGRIVSQYKDLYRVATGEREILAEITGKMRYSANEISDYPAVGDFVMIDREEDLHGNAIIHHILPRKSVFTRRAAGNSQDIQVIAANIDFIFICMSLNNDFNLRRLERYLSIAWDSGATPVIILTKADLCHDISVKISEINTIAFGIDILVASALTEDGYTDILKYISSGQTVAFVGSSGVGKSTLINRLLGEDIVSTREIRQDDKGRHTTTTRELFIIPGGGAVIDTPGMRELGLENANVTKTFSDIEELAKSCRFIDCRHEHEPGCAVKQAIEDGLITEERLNSYRKLSKEAKYENLNSKQIEQEKINSMFSEFNGMKNARDYIKSKNKNR
ncbi:MAG: ribosome small subunit-dependent GTPase A [Syntrophomonadaceae bacterium]